MMKSQLGVLLARSRAQGHSSSRWRLQGRAACSGSSEQGRQLRQALWLMRQQQGHQRQQQQVQ